MHAQPLGIRSGDRELLGSWTRSSSVRAGLAQRARIVLLAADGVSNTEIAERVGVARQTVISVPGQGMMPWREHLFVLMQRNARTAADYYQIPANRVIELGTQVEI